MDDVTTKKTSDFVVSTGKQFSVEEFAEEAFKYVGLDYNKYVKINKDLIRPAEVDSLLGDSNKAKRILKWKPKITFKELVRDMVQSDLDYIKNKVTKFK